MSSPGNLYIVATPIGNLADITYRAKEILATVDRIAAEDTRHSSRLLQHLHIAKPMIALHEHNEQKTSEKIIQFLRAGQQIDYISDAGTPLISDPGRNLVKLAHQHQIPVIPIPGPCALVAALSVAGFAGDEFMFMGFLPAKKGQRQQYLEQYKEMTCTLAAYEAPHRILDSLMDMCACFGDEREALVAREMTKMHETISRGTLLELLTLFKTNTQYQQGEFVIIIQGAPQISQKELTPEVEKILTILLKELKINTAARVCAEITGVNKNLLYKVALNKS